MVIYCCDRCGYSTNHRSVFKKHLNRKNPCKNYLSNTDIATIKGKYNFISEEKNETLHNSVKTPSKFTPKSSKFTPNSSFLENPCIICNVVSAIFRSPSFLPAFLSSFYKLNVAFFTTIKL